MKGKITTVTGDITPEQAGTIITHEHLIVDVSLVYSAPSNLEDYNGNEKISLENVGWVSYNWNNNKDNLILDDPDLAIEEIKLLKEAGGNTIVDVTPIGINRQPELIKNISIKSGVNVIMGSSFYVQPSHPDYILTENPEQLSKRIIHDIEEGVENTGIRSGIIGEVGCTFPWHESEKKVLLASIIAQQETGAPLLIHPGRNESSPAEIVEFIQKNNGDLSRTIIGHIERTIFNPKILLELASSGVYMNFDLFGNESSHYPLTDVAEKYYYMPNDHQRIEQVGLLVDSGYSKKILLGHDICTKHRLKAFGGHGWDHILINIVPRMKKYGISTQDIENMIANNPQKILTII